MSGRSGPQAAIDNDYVLDAGDAVCWCVGVCVVWLADWTANFDIVLFPWQS